jgi:predicted nucleic acid-binding protein
MIVMKKYMRIIEPRNCQSVLRLAYTITMRSTFYDAAYVVAAAENRLTLVTDDKRLLNNLSSNRRVVVNTLGSDIEVIDSATLLKRTSDRGTLSH